MMFPAALLLSDSGTVEIGLASGLSDCGTVGVGLIARLADFGI